ncbi:MAG: L,D-transpeptidase family protein [Synechocystis sp.]
MNNVTPPLSRLALWLGSASLAITSLGIPSLVQAETTLTAPTTAPVSETVPATPVVTPATPVTAPKTAPKTAAPSATSKPLATRVVLVLGEKKVYAYQNDKILASFPVAIGKKGWETPKGNFQVLQMVENPVWENPWNGKKIPASLDGPLGVRWIGFWTDGKNTIGFHGTPKKHEHFLGKAVSHGCVRMRNPDVIALYNMVQTGIPVSVVQAKPVVKAK